MSRQLKWGSLDNLNNLIDQYFNDEPFPTIAGLRMALHITQETWIYYTKEAWRKHRRSPEEIEEIVKEMENEQGEEVFKDWTELSEKVYLVEEFTNKRKDRGQNDRLKAELSNVLKNARDRIEVAINKLSFVSKNPAGAIFYSKCALEYRETAPLESASASAGQTKITINILPAPTTQTLQITADNSESVPTTLPED